MTARDRLIVLDPNPNERTMTMTIDDAIEMLQSEKTRGVKHIIISHWTADQFDRADDRIWGYISDAVFDADWGFVNDTLSAMVEHVIEDQEIGTE